MTSKTFVMKEIIYSANGAYFGNPPPSVRHEAISIEPKKSTIIVSYGIRTDLKYNEILKIRPQLSQIVHGIFGNGFQTFDSKLYEVQNHETKLVGFVRSRIPHLSGRPLLKNPLECVLLLSQILASQLQHKSLLADGLFAALSKANMGGFVNTAFAWAWWGFEWLIQHLEEKNPAPRKLGSAASGLNGSKRNLRKYFKKKIQATVREYEKEITDDFELDNSQTIRFNAEIKGIKEQINDKLLKPSFIEVYENQIPFLSSSVDLFLNIIRTSPSENIVRELFKDWRRITEEIVKPAKAARDGGFHEGKYKGLLRAHDNDVFDTYSGMMKFVGWVCTLLSIILIRPPFDYDPKCKREQPRFELTTLGKGVIQDVIPIIPNEGSLEWTEYENGEVVRYSTPVSQVVLRDDWILELLPEKIPKPSSASCLIDMRKPRSADFTFIAEGVQIEGAFEFDTRPHHLKIRKFLSN